MLLPCVKDGNIFDLTLHQMNTWEKLQHSLILVLLRTWIEILQHIQVCSLMEPWQCYMLIHNTEEKVFQLNFTPKIRFFCYKVFVWCEYMYVLCFIQVSDIGLNLILRKMRKSAQYLNFTVHCSIYVLSYVLKSISTYPLVPFQICSGFRSSRVQSPSNFHI